MTEQLEQASGEMITALTELLKETKGAVESNFPDFANQILINGTNQAWFNICFSIVGIVFFITLCIFLWKFTERFSEFDDELRQAIRGSSSVLCVCFCIIFLCLGVAPAVRELITIKSAPKVYVTNVIMTVYVQKLRNNK